MEFQAETFIQPMWIGCSCFTATLLVHQYIAVHIVSTRGNLVVILDFYEI